MYDFHFEVVLLAAGQSRRMGKPKMLLPWGYHTIISHCLETFMSNGSYTVTVVAGKEHDEIRQMVWDTFFEGSIQFVYNDEYENGNMLTSAIKGLEAVSPEARAVFIALGDQPQLNREVVRGMLEAFQNEPDRLWVPSFEMHRGHPWLLPRKMFDALIQFPPHLTMRDFLEQNAENIRYFDADESVLKDIDTPDDYQREKP